MIKHHRKDLKVFMGLLLLFNGPTLLIYARIPIISALAFLPAMFWININGTLHHIIIRGIERKKIEDQVKCFFLTMAF